jgi:hypothetical protein
MGSEMVSRLKMQHPLEYRVLDKLDLDFDELEILIENTKERLEAAQSILKGS